jgi:hypothetical protein
LQHSDQTYWFTEVAELHGVYAQINSMENASDESFDAFCDRLMKRAASSNAENLVVDLRLNNGGDNTLDPSLVRRVVASRFNRSGHLFVIIGRLTFSAAVNLTAELELQTRAIFVGEPTAAPANHYGETARFLLPQSGLTVLYSTRFWQGGLADDHRPWIPPSLATPLRAEDDWLGKDPALAAIRHAIGG